MRDGGRNIFPCATEAGTSFLSFLVFLSVLPSFFPFPFFLSFFLPSLLYFLHSCFLAFCLSVFLSFFLVFFPASLVCILLRFSPYLPSFLQSCFSLFRSSLGCDSGRLYSLANQLEGARQEDCISQPNPVIILVTPLGQALIP